MTAEVRIYKCRTQTLRKGTPKDRMVEMFKSSNFWTRVNGVLLRVEKLDSRYPGYKVYELDVPKRTGQVWVDPPLSVPCKGTLIAKINDELIYGGISYESVQVMDPCPTQGGFYMMKISEEPKDVDMSHIPNEKWLQVIESYGLSDVLRSNTSTVTRNVGF